MFDERDVEFDYGEGSAIGIVEGLEIALEKINIGETSKYVHIQVLQSFFISDLVHQETIYVFDKLFSRIKIQPIYAFGSKGSEEFKIPPNSTVEYTVKLIDCGKGLEEWKLSDSERIAEAKVYKEKGTNYFKKENYSLAIKMYTKCNNLLPNIKDNESEEVKALKVATHSNIALSHQKSNNHFEAKTEVCSTQRIILYDFRI